MAKDTKPSQESERFRWRCLNCGKRGEACYTIDETRQRAKWKAGEEQVA